MSERGGLAALARGQGAVKMPLNATIRPLQGVRLERREDESKFARSMRKQGFCTVSLGLTYMPQLLTTLRSLVLALSFQVLAGFGAAAQPIGPDQLRAAQEFVADRHGLLAPVQVFGLQADLFCRSYFVELRRDTDWGPNHPNWEKGRAQFCAELIGIALPPGLSLEAYLVNELAKELSPAELAQLNERNSEPSVVAAAGRLQEQGFSWQFFAQAERPSGTAGLYSSAERESARRTVQILRRELPGTEQDMRLVFSLTAVPAFEKYQRAVGQAFMNTLGRLNTNPGGPFMTLMRAWHTKVSEPSK